MIFRLIYLSLLCFFLASLPAKAQELGMLFSNAQEREYLDQLRQEFLARNAAANFDIAEIVPPFLETENEADTSITITEFSLGAIISRSNGSHTIWLNNVALEPSQLPDNISLINSNSNPALLITNEDQQFILKPGQSVDISNENPAAIETSQPAQNNSTPEEESSNEVQSLMPIPVLATLQSTPLNQAIPETPDAITNTEIDIPELIQSLQSLQESMGQENEP